MAASKAAKAKTNADKKKNGENTKKLIGSKELADRLGTTGASLRRWLRANDTKHEGRYEWEEGSPQLKKVVEAYQADQKEKEKTESKPEKKGKKGNTRASSREEDEEEEDNIEEM